MRPLADHYLSRDEVVYSLDAQASPRLFIDSGAIVTIETHDARGGRLKRPDQVEETTPDFSERFPKANPATGPIFVNGVAPGDSIGIEILDIDLDPAGFILVKPDMGILRDFGPKPIARICQVADGIVDFNGLLFPTRPMVGVIGVAPAGEAIGTAFVGAHGGNIDTSLASPGNSLSLTARVSGGLVYVGDVHAAMGDGEVSGTGVEIGARVTVRIIRENDRGKNWPRLRTRTHHVVLTSAPTFEAASEIAVREMIKDLREGHDLTAADAFMLVSATGDLRVNQACRSKIDVSVRLEMPLLQMGARAQ